MTDPRAPTPYRAAWWLPGAHWQTLWPFLFRPAAPPVRASQRLELPDGDFVDLAWFGAEQAPVVLVLHGLEGGLRSHYVRRTVHALNRAGYQSCVFQFRGCSGEPNRLARSYHSGDTGDLARVLEQLRGQGQPAQAAIGYSLGGNVLLKWLGEQGARASLRCAMAVSVPFDLGDAADRMATGLSRIYQRYLIDSLARKCRGKFRRHGTPSTIPLSQLRTFRRFDDQVTAPLHGFADVNDYYARSSSRQFLHAIRIPTLLLHAADDPFMYPTTVPTAAELADSVELELVQRGGHVGFVTGGWPGRGRCWFSQRLTTWLGANDVHPYRNHPTASR